MESDSGKIVVRAVNSSGGTEWTYNLEGFPVSSVVDVKENIFVMMLMPYDWTINYGGLSPAAVIALNPKTGRRLWTQSLESVRGGPLSFGGELEIAKEAVWWAAGGRAVRLSLKSGKPSWNSEMETEGGVGSLWKYRPEGAIALRGSRLMAFLKDLGLQWQRELFKEECQAHGLFWTDSGILASCRHEMGVVVTLFDTTSGSLLWTKNLKHKVSSLGPTPTGIAVTPSRVILIANKRLLGFDLGTGTEIFNLKMKKDVVENIRELRQMKNHFVLIGRNQVTAHSFEAGGELWKKDGFEDPYLLKQELKRGSLSTTFLAAYQAMGQAHYGMGVAQGIDPNLEVSPLQYKQGVISYSQHFSNVQNKLSVSKVKKQKRKSNIQEQAFDIMAGPRVAEQTLSAFFICVPVCVNLNVVFPLLWCCGLFKDCLYRTDRLTGSTIDAFIWMNVELIFTFINAIYWANVHARLVFDPNTGLGDNVSHG